MNELNKKLAEWAGFCRRGRSYTGVSLWVSPNEIEHFDKVAKEQDGEEYTRMPERDTHYKLPDFTESLDLCFKWLVPELKCPYISLLFDGEWSAGVWFNNTENSSVACHAESEKPATALCLAMEKLIDGEK